MAMTDSTDIRWNYARGLVILGWERDTDELRVHDPKTGRESGYEGRGLVTPNDWHEITFEITDVSLRVIVDGKERHQRKADYKGLNAPIGIGGFPGTKLTVKEISIEKLRENIEMAREERPPGVSLLPTNPIKNFRFIKSRFVIIKGNFTWLEASSDAQARGGRLAVLDSKHKYEQAYIHLGKVRDYPHLWIGLTDQGNEGRWKWINGKSLEGGNWRRGEPNDRDGDSNWTVILDSGHERNAGGKWNDEKLDAKWSYLIEYPGGGP
jgi:hypothetical protein